MAKIIDVGAGVALIYHEDGRVDIAEWGADTPPPTTVAEAVECERNLTERVVEDSNN